jgi:hydrogenase-4 component B
VTPLLLFAIGSILFTGFLAACLGKTRRAGEAVGAWGGAVSSLFGLAVVIAALLRREIPAISLPWNTVVGASFSLEMDALSGFFLLPVFGLSAVSAVFGGGTLSEYRTRKNLGAHWLFFNTLTASMALVVLARNAVLFLAAWEIMSISSFFLVTFEGEREEVRSAGVTYLIASQIGVAFLLALFLLMGAADTAGIGGGAALDFSRFRGISGSAAGAAFILALAGFGTKAGIVPLHVWLPEAHPAAPSHVSAVMSGVMIKMGVYGLVRILSFLVQPQAWWGWTLTVVGAVSGVIGVLFALAQHDVKRLLAYHSVENIGIIFLGLGVGLLGQSYDLPAVAVLGYCGGLLHVVNHALFKGLLFLGAGAATHAAGSRDMDRLGGLSKRMPVTAAAFLVGAAAICGLPPLNGFVSEFLIYVGAIRSAASSTVSLASAGGVIVTALALIGGLAAACFAKAFGITFLGEPRGEPAGKAHEAGAAELITLVFLAACCAGIGLLGPAVLSWIAPLAAAVAGISPDTGVFLILPWRGALGKVVLAAAVLAGIVLALAALRALLLSRRRISRSGTWDCGYVKPDARMQYTSSSFAQPIVDMFRGILGSRKKQNGPQGLFPQEGSFHSETPDVFEHKLIRPALSGMGRLIGGMRRFQHGRLQVYVLYIAVTIIALLIWRLA